MGWVLILLLSAYGSDGGNALATAQFATKELCEAAGAEAAGLGQAVRYRKQIEFRCVAAAPPRSPA